MTKSYNLSMCFATLFLFLLSAFNCSAADWLCFTAEKDGSTIWFENEGDNNPSIQYSFDGDSWSDWNEKATITLENTEDKVYVRGDNSKGFSFNAKKYTHFGMKGKISASGSVMSLIDPNESSTEIPNSGCFFKLFSDCKSLTQAPKLPATTLKDSCYYSLFENCENLATVPELPAMTMTKYCYSGMFSGCLNLTKAPELPSLTLAPNCYSSMFTDCKNLEVAPELPATKLEEYCYSTMFTACEKLKKAPDLPAKNLVDFCYFFMFERCSGLESAEISATELGPKSCIAMFMGCSNMNYIKIDVMTLDNDMSATDSWVMGVTQEGIIEFPCGSKYNKYGDSEAPNNFTIKASPIVIFQNPDKEELWRDTIGCDVVPQYPFEEKGEPFYKDGLIFKGWDVKPHVHETPDIYYYTAVYGEEDDIDLDKILCFTALESNCTISYNCMGKPCPDLHFSLDSGKTWESMEDVLNIELENVGDKVYVRGNNPTGFHNTPNDYFHFIMKEKIAASGSVMSLLDMKGELTEIPCDYCFLNLFSNCSLVQAPDLPATVLTKGCYKGMFSTCRSLQKAPELPAETVKEESYEVMFNGCTNLSEAPKLNATTLGKHCYFAMFTGCTNLTKAYDLPAKKLEEACYANMFIGCESLKAAPALPATELADSCYYYMFLSCENMATAPKLPATTLKESCYGYMFVNCKSIEEVPDLEATVVAENSCNGMFINCTNLRKAPALPAKKLESNCYSLMFATCINLEKAPELPATELANECYSNMFSGCTSMKEAPELPATELADGCYFNMFGGCTSLNYIKVRLMTLDNEVNATENWVNGIDGPGTFIFPCGSKYDKHGASEVPENFDIISSPIVVFQNPDKKELWRDTIGCDVVPEYPFEEKGEPFYKDGLVFKGWDEKPHVHETPDIYYYTAVYEGEENIDLDKILCFTALEANADISYGCMNINCPEFEYSLDSGKTWNILKEFEKIELQNEGDKVYFRGNNPNGLSKSINEYSYFTTNYKLAASGSVMSLLDGKGESTVIPCDYCFTNLFNHCSLVQAPELPATELTKGCYSGMFSSCNFLQKAPELPAKTVKEESYSAMFSGCLNLTETPELRATTLGEHCYKGMFVGCGNLIKAHDLPAMKLETGCYENMFTACQRLETPPALPATELADSCYNFMFLSCNSLTKAPLLPATTLKKSCYDHMFTACINLEEVPDLGATVAADRSCDGMFISCNNLKKAPALPATTLDDNCYHLMFAGCTNLTEAPKLPATVMKDNCYFSMFASCLSLEKAPVLPATELAKGCYTEMFTACHKLNYIKVGITTLDNEVNATENWVDGIDGPGVFIFPCGSKYDKHGVSEVPDNFKIISSPIAIFQNPDSTVLYRDTINCGEFPSYERCDTCKTPYYGDSLVFINWDKDIDILNDPDIYYYTAVYEKKGEKPNLDKMLCFTAEEAGSKISYLSINKKDNYHDVQYSIDGGENWYRLEPKDYITLEKVGDKVYFRGKNPKGLTIGRPDSRESYFLFTMEGKIAASGSIMSMIDGIGETTVIPCDYCFEYLFAGCDALTQAPELTATELKEFCYYNMFDACTSLTKAPELPATTLAESCYFSMFGECTSLTQAPELPASELADGCYMGMFGGCTSLTQAPVLPATELAEDCYSLMFARCTSLIKVPELPATNLTVGCYDGMFAGCSSLTKAPELPATKLAAGCYNGMFDGCSSLAKAPELPAKELVFSCYKNMFSECSKLDTIKVGVMSLDNDFAATENWVDGIDGPGVFIFPCGSQYDKHGVSEVPDKFIIIASPIVVFQNPDGKELWRDTIGCDVVPEYPLEEKGEPFYKEGLVFKGWDVEPHVHETPDTYYYTAVYEEKTDTTVENNWLCFTAEAPESEIWYYNTNNNPDVQYSIDGGKTWKTLEEGVKVTLENKDDKVYFKGNNPEGFSHGMVERTVFKMSGQIAASGSVMSLIDEKGKTKVIPNDFCFSLLFAGCTSLTQAPELPATTLTKTCYEFMFEDCINLTEAPELPATKIFDKSYVGMFMGCRNLKKAPTLPATEMKYRCYDSMFRLCTSLETPPALPATELAQECYHQMFNECTNLKEAPELPATKMAEYCYGLMFCECENLKIAPKLPATELAPACYYSMFASCINLTQAPEILPATTLESACYSGMFFLCTALEKAPKLPATTLAEGCYVSMFKECSSLTQAPELPATTLAEGCYAGMFNECSSLTQAPELPAITLTKECYAGMFEDCSSLTQAPELPASELIDSCYLEMFKGCANLNYIKVGVMSLDNEFNATENWVDSVDGPGVFIFPCGSQYDKHGASEVPPLFEIIANKYSIGYLTSACDSIVYKGTTYYESKEWHDTLSTSYGCDSIIAYKLIVHNSVETNMDINIENSFVWKDITYTDDATWIDSLQTSFGCDSIVHYNLTIIKKEKKELNLSVDDELILILPGETENVGYEITGGIGSQYEIRYKGKLICSGDVSNDSTVDLTCAKNMEPGEYIATMEMCDDEGNCAKEDFTFNVMLPDDKEKSYYVKVWNDVVICRNGDGNHVSYQWYKDKKKCEDANLQYFNDKSLLGGEYMVHVTDKDGKSYFIEPIKYEAELAGYGISANPNIVEKSAEFTVSVTGVSEDDLTNARIVVYKADGIVEKILNNVEANTTMRLGSGEYIIVLTVNDGKNANCKVLVK